jgi:hypothetical protein
MKGAQSVFAIQVKVGNLLNEGTVHVLISISDHEIVAFQHSRICQCWNGHTPHVIKDPVGLTWEKSIKATKGFI